LFGVDLNCAGLHFDHSALLADFKLNIAACGVVHPYIQGQLRRLEAFFFHAQGIRAAAEEYVPATLMVAWTVCPVGPVMVTLALGTTAPAASVTVPEILPFDTEVWANATEHNRSADKATSASSVNRALRRGEPRLSMLCLPFGIHLKFSGSVLRKSRTLCGTYDIRNSIRMTVGFIGLTADQRAW
jgi:hypothetical protein